MKFSRLLGVAITGGVLFGCEFAHAQVNYRLPSNLSTPTVAPALLPTPSSYPTTHHSTYPPPNTSQGPGYSVASLPPLFAGPTNAPMTRLPPSETSGVRGASSSANGVPGTNSVLLTPQPQQQPQSQPQLQPQPNIGPIMANEPRSYNGQFNGPLNGQHTAPLPTSPTYGSGLSPIYTGLGNGTANGSEKMPTVNNQNGKGIGCATGFNPWGGSECASSCAVGKNGWYGGVYGMVLAQNGQAHYTFSYSLASEDIQFTDAKDGEMGWGGGFAAVLGRCFNCGQNAYELVYWGWFPDQESVYTYGANVAGGIGGIFNWDSLTYNGLNMGAGFVDNAAVHGLFHESEVHNVEFNVLSFNSSCGTGPCSLSLTWLAGWRYFRFRDHLTFMSDPNDTAFTGEVDEVFYDISTTNDLIGFQLGGVGTYMLGQRVSLNAGTKVGFFGNHISHTSQIGGTAGTAVINNGPNNGQAFLVDNSKNDVAFLTEIFLGAGYAFNSCWSLSAGYRAIALTGMAMPTDQIYPDLRGINDLYTIESDSAVLLHGAYFGAQFNF